MPRHAVYEWEGREYRFEEKSADWYWALGIIATAAAIASILFGNVILALVIGAAAAALAATAAKAPRVHKFALFDDGVAIDNDFYSYDGMLHYSVLEYADPSLPPSLSIKTRHFLSPHLLIPIIGHDPVEIYEYMALHLEDGRHDESPITRISELFRI